jgi:hypothetical protein
MRDTAAAIRSVEDEEDFFDMANLPPDVTGLPMVVWVSQQGRARHDVRVKVSLVPGRHMNPDQTTSVSVRPDVEVVAGDRLPPSELAAVRRWVDANRQVIIDYWDGKLFTNELLERLVRI